MIKRRYAFALALVICLTATLFIVTSTGYDPWVDQDEDGDVDATDLNVLAGEYGSTGNPTKNVSVTNWPEPQKPTFAEILVLRGLYYALFTNWRTTPPYDTARQAANILVTEDMPYPPREQTDNYTYLFYEQYVPTEWTLGEIVNFTFIPAGAPFFIQGDVIVRPTIHYDLLTLAPWDVMHWNTTMYLEKTSPDLSTTVLASHTFHMSINVTGNTFEIMDHIGVTFNFPEPAIVEVGERLQLRFETWGRSDLDWIDTASIMILHTLGTDEFIAYIPIYQP